MSSNVKPKRKDDEVREKKRRRIKSKTDPNRKEQKRTESHGNRDL